jgi:hypothetical protein
VIDGVKYDLPGIAKDGELLVSPHDANIELRIREVTEALRAGKAGPDRRACEGVEVQASARRRRPGTGWHLRSVPVTS